MHKLIRRFKTKFHNKSMQYTDKDMLYFTWKNHTSQYHALLKKFEESYPYHQEEFQQKYSAKT